ncbi:hypothetical protein [Parvularcula sp. IMCC14364]|uniref:hypothetical protein n=1 Tax=Parvularcula sp. IMCC14364 TaxID=3067902 RepID=UPI0027416D81|nr:hypothetical protein [Parvularcula sp. IMCC14364]
MKLSIYGTITDALGFAWHKYETALRLAWFPLLLLFFLPILFVYLYATLTSGGLVTPFGTSYFDAIGLITDNADRLSMRTYWTVEFFRFVFTLILQTSYLIPLFRFAARDVMPPEGSVYLRFGWRHLKYIVLQVLVGLGIALLTYLPLFISLMLSTAALMGIEGEVFAVFPNPDSLHTIETETVVPWFVNVIPLALIGLFLIALIYFSLRLYAVPIFGAVREKGDGYNSLMLSLKISSGWNVLRLLAINIVLLLLMLALLIAVQFVIVPLVAIVLSLIFTFIQSAGNLVPSEAASDPSGGQDLILAFVLHVLLMFYMVFTQALNAGFAGSLFRQGAQFVGTPTSTADKT